MTLEMIDLSAVLLSVESLHGVCHDANHDGVNHGEKDSCVRGLNCSHDELVGGMEEALHDDNHLLPILGRMMPWDWSVLMLVK